MEIFDIQVSSEAAWTVKSGVCGRGVPVVAGDPRLPDPRSLRDNPQHNGRVLIDTSRASHVAAPSPSSSKVWPTPPDAPSSPSPLLPTLPVIPLTVKISIPLLLEFP
ncbi:hypothetical protein O3P69_010376 [Scylla paramamosain]|uniref:Uncharacterized protein n=1 Tax=Scylla paramamosain TaxID=85552 RepID=A0AAW0TWQ4_SCYPA